MSQVGEAPRRGSGSVRKLPDALIDQIAAGEVVERPASVVKELVENALDADARRVRVEVRAGGRDWIAVSDDGLGMSPEDARLALERHATSKLSRSEDLQRIATFGFRGEALPAIASVSHMRLRTRARGAAEGFELEIEAGKRIGERATGTPEGTRFEVADLFANVPARRKFLKSASTEWGHIGDWLSRSALALPAVHFDVQRDDRPALSWPAAADPLDRIAAVLSEEDAAAMVSVDSEEAGTAVRGFVSRPDRHRSNLSGVYLFVNDRPVRDRLLQHALLSVYRELLPTGRFPSAVLFLSLPRERVDVNVHPAKWEVRFDDPQAVHRALRHAAERAISERRWLTSSPPQQHRADSGDPHRETTSDWVFAAQRAAADPTAAASLFESAPAETVGAASGARLSELRLLGQLLGTYLVLEAKDRLLLVDQHAAHERVLYERLRASWREGQVPRQGLLAPVLVQLDPARAAALSEFAEAVARLGFEAEPFGEGAFSVRALPVLLADRDPARSLRELADELVDEGVDLGRGPDASRTLEAADRLFASLACHAARRKGDVLDPREQQALLEAVDSIPWAPTCPHGRPVAVPLELSEIERRFGRR